MSDDRMLDEHVLRRALRLDADEVPSRLDPRLIAAAARTSPGRRTEVVAIGAAAFLAGWLWSEGLRAVIASSGLDPLGLTIELGTRLLIGAAPFAEALTQPSIPIAIFSAALVAALFERRRAHAAAS